MSKLSISGYCILRGRKLQKVSDFPHFTPKISTKGAWMGILKLNAQNIKTCILSKLLHRFKPNFVQWQRPPSTLRGWSKRAYNKSKMADSLSYLLTYLLIYLLTCLETVEKNVLMCVASGTCKSSAHSQETVVLQYGDRRLPADTDSRELTTTAEVTLSEHSSSSENLTPTTFPVVSQSPTTTAGPDSEKTSTSSSAECTNWTDVEQFR